MATVNELKPSRRARHGGRSERIRKNVADTVLGLIKAGELDFQLQDIARLSGVHRTTIYRRWPDRASLIAEAIKEHNFQFDIAYTGDFQTDLTHAAFTLRDALSSPVEQALNALLVTDAKEHDELRAQMVEQWEPVMKLMEQPIRDAQKRHEISEAVDPRLQTAMLTTTILTSIMFLKEVPSDGYIERLVDQIVYTCGKTPT